MLQAVPRLLITSLLLASCMQAPSESRITANTIGLSGHDPKAILDNRALARALMTHPLADAQGRLSAATEALLRLADTSTETFSQLVACALPEDAVLEGTVEGSDLQFFGGHGLAPQWRTAPLNLDGQRWVSACMFAKLNGEDLHIGISMRGPHPGLALMEFEDEAYILEDGAYYGNMFVPLNQPIQWYACRGRDMAAGAHGDLNNRDCGIPDPNKPALTKCGLSYTGDCGSFAVNHACELFATNGTYYRRCHTAPSQNGQFQGSVIDQVITVFVRD